MSEKLQGRDILFLSWNLYKCMRKSSLFYHHVYRIKAYFQLWDEKEKYIGRIPVNIEWLLAKIKRITKLWFSVGMSTTMLLVMFNIYTRYPEFHATNSVNPLQNCLFGFSSHPLPSTLCSIASHLVVDKKQSDKLILTEV